ncbi:MAG: GNAT family N-acetyltransferase [Alphaproteobacteria bacterium]|nr:GNAT family N-acetyltransferase [Alphaproteobacteria bacterium]
MPAVNRKKTTRRAIRLRELKPSEIPDIFPLIHLHNATVTRPVFTARLADMLPFGYRVVAAFDGARMVGISGFWVHSRFWCGRHLDIDNFFVHPDYRARGIGRRLVAWLEKRALAEQCQLMVLDAYADSFLAHRFYHRQGFVATGTHFTKLPGSLTPWALKR